jgi:hypothetical protein
MTNNSAAAPSIIGMFGPAPEPPLALVPAPERMYLMPYWKKKASAIMPATIPPIIIKNVFKKPDMSLY